MQKERKNQTIKFKNKPRIVGNYSIVGPKEGEGPFGKMFDYVMEDDFYGEKTYEKAERKMLEHAIFGATEKAGLTAKKIDMLICGDLLNQIITSSYAARVFDVSYLGIFSACSAMALSLGIGSAMIDSGYFDNVACATSSHFSTAERQFRFPLELGNQRPPTAQWTCTASGCSIVSKEGNGPYVDSITFGKVMDFGVTDVNNMGAAMAPAAMETLISVFEDTNTTPGDYDLIVTGDLGKLGSEILIDLMESQGYKLGTNYGDCGQMMFYHKQNVLMGGSGCGCSASIFNSYIVERLKTGQLKNVLYVATGALLSTTACQQGETIPGIAHAIVVKSAPPFEKTTVSAKEKQTVAKKIEKQVEKFNMEDK